MGVRKGKYILKTFDKMHVISAFQIACKGEKMLSCELIFLTKIINVLMYFR